MVIMTSLFEASSPIPYNPLCARVSHPRPGGQHAGRLAASEPQQGRRRSPGHPVERRPSQPLCLAASAPALPLRGCNEERQRPPDPFRILKPNELGPLKPTAITPVGHYAYKITWSDGHDTGIFTLENLRALCECEQCQPSTLPTNAEVPNKSH